MTSFRISNPKYFVEEEPKGTSKCLREVRGASAVDSRTALRRAAPCRGGRICTVCDARSKIGEEISYENKHADRICFQIFGQNLNQTFHQEQIVVS
jgi:hypothetical protein